MKSSRHHERWISILLSGGLLTACVSGPPDDDDRDIGGTEQKTQCGPSWDVQDVERYDGTLGVSTAFVARHEARVGYSVTAGCSGTLISDDLFLSAGHCAYLVGDIVRFNYQNDPGGAARPTQDFTVTSIVEQENAAAWDYAIVRLGGSPGREFGHASIAAVDPPVGSLVAIIQHPAGVPKKIHAGRVFDYASPDGPNWFRHQVDTTNGTSGSGVLDIDGRLVGIHTSPGCSTSTPINGNSAIRMSQLVAHSPTLQALTRSKLLWQHDDGRVSLWSVEADGTFRSARVYGPYPDWTPISYSNDRILWRHSGGRISYWVLDDDSVLSTFVEHGPFGDWTAVNHANDRILWRHLTGRISLWTVDAAGNHLSHVEYGPFPGWTAISYANNRILWRHDTGTVALWVLDDSGSFLTSVWYGPFAGWTAVSYANGELLWKSDAGQTSLYSLDRSGNFLSSFAHGPFAGWTPVATADRKLLWRHDTGKISYWTTNSDGAHLSHVEHGPFAGWNARLTTGGAP